MLTVLASPEAAETTPLPLTLAGLLGWYDLRPPYLTDAGGGDISAAADRAGLLSDITQATASKRPLYNANAFGSGYGGIEFDGIDETLYNAVCNTLAGGPFTLFCGIDLGSLPASNGDGRTILSWVHDLSGAAGYVSCVNVSGTARWEFIYRDAAGAGSIARANSAVPTTGKQSIIVQHGATVDRIYINGVSQTVTYRVGSFTAAMDGAGRDIWLGSNSDVNRYFDGAIGCIFGCNAEVDASTIADGHAYIVERLNI